ncbi:MAG: hypothetical protein ACP5NZ_04590 [Nanobdellota archaeon]
MKKRGVSSISLILFSIFSIILFSSIVSAEACSGSTTIPSCFLLTSSGEYVCNQFSQACHWYLGSCLANSGVYCDDITNVPSCGAIACPGSTICTSGPCCDTSVPGGAIRPSTYICATKNAFFMCNEATDIVRIEGEVQYCNGVNTACTGTIRWEVQSPSYQSCSTQNGCIDDYFFPNVCTCAGSTSWSLPPTTAYISSCSSCAVPPSPGFPGCAGTCTDTDGGLGYTTYGYTYLAGYGSSTSQYDSCSSSTTLNEKYCVGGVQSQNSYSCTNLGSQYSCSGGRCVCTPNCAGKNCGSDGCGSNCGSCSGTQTCVSGVCQDNCMATGAAGCTSVGTASNQCCSGMCIEGTCRSSCSGYTGSQNRCTSTSTIYQSFGICTTAGCDQSVAALSGGTYYGDCSGRSDGTSADRDSLAGGYSANGICCTNSAVATPTGFGSSCDGSDADYCMEGTILCTGSCSDSTGSTYENSVALCHDGSDNDCDGNTDCSDSQCVGIASENTASSCADGVDNDCDGNTDCADSQCTSLLTSTACDGSDADSCAEGFRYVCGSGCSDSTGSTYENTFALCTDGSDNDCEGGIDCADASCNGVSGTSNCDQDGRCAGAVRTCSGGTLSACSITPISEVCNSIDDNCDGSVDNGITCTCDNGDTQTQSCGTGACFRTVSQTCVSGAWTPACTPGTAGTETTTATCSDSSDNDCDGTTDCSDSGCTSLLTSTTCDGAADGDLCREGFVFLCGGACSDVTGTTTENTFALCTDSSDNDCDTSTDCADSGCTGLSGTSDCDQDGLCAGAVRTCSGGSLSACSITPIGEVCNNQDDNCDGSVDNGITCSCTIGETDTCGSNIGECEYGITTCLIGGIWGACVGGVTPVTENTNTLCHNGLDDSCNSLIDCADPTCLNVVAETCGNSIDDDCDGTPDDGCLCAEGATQPCGTDVGECAFGVQTCTGGAWGTCIGGVTAIPEVCGDGLDNDCDGTPDNGCGLGICGDGAINTGEDCDDGGTVNGDGCSAACTIESGWTCVGEPSVCNLLPSCGDGNLDVGEECDDDDNSPGDGCDGSCNVEDGWVCVGAPSVCSHECSFQANSAHWNPLQVLDGEDVRMEFILIGDCNGEEITFEVREDDLLSSSYVATPASIIYGPSSTYGTWTAIIVADSGGPEYYFIATITSTGESTSSSTNYANELKVLEDSTCYLPLEGRSIAYCSDYDETLCEFDVCGVGVNITLLDPTIQCGGEYECGCIWDSDTDTCGYMWNGTTNLGPNAADIDGDGILNGDDPDFDGDGNLDAPFDINPNGDHDSDGTINSLDGDYINSGDIDGDGIPNGDDPDFDGDDALEGYYSGIDPNGDIDGDGTPNIRDRDMDGDGVNNGDDLDFDRNGSNDGRYIGFTEDSEFGIGTCSYLESTGGGECINGVRVWTLSHTWTWSPENVQYFLDNGVYLDPFSQESKCQDINRQLECSPGAQVNFFGIYQLVIVIAIVALIYVLYILRKRNLNKKKKVKHKVKSKRSKKRR